MECVWNCQRAILKWFYVYGHFLAKHPFWFLIIPLVICGGFAVGFKNLKFNEDPEKLYTPSTSRSLEERDIVSQEFDDMSNVNYSLFSLNGGIPQSFIIFRSKQERAILTEAVFQELAPFYHALITMNVADGPWNYTINNVCKKRDGACVIHGSFVFEDRFLDKVKAGNVTYPTWKEQPEVDMSRVFARENISLSKSLLSAGSLKISFPLRGWSRNWETAFIKLIRETKFTTVDVAYSISSSLSEELDAGTMGDIRYFCLTFTLMITFATIVSSGGDCVTSRILLANAGVLAVGFGIVGAIGLVLLCEVQFVNIVGIMPFLVLGIGVDDMFLLMSSWSETLPMTDLTIPERIGTVYRKAGIGITITSVTDFLAFAIGASSRFRSVKNFCIYTGVAVLLCYICNACVFGACLTLHARRVYASRHSITCRKTKSRKQLKEEGASCLKMCLCGGEIPTTSEGDQSVCEWGPRKVLVRFLLWNPVRYLTLLVFAVYLAVAIWGCTQLKEGLELKNLAPTTSYYHKFKSWDDEDFGTKLPISFVIHKQKDYTKPETLQEIKQLLQKAQEDPLIESNFSICWFTQLADTEWYNVTNPQAFAHGLKMFLQRYPILLQDLVFGWTNKSTLPNAIRASRCHVYSRKVTTSNEQASLMSSMRKVADASPAGVFAFNPLFVTYEQFLVILHDTLQTVGITIAVMFVATCIFLPHPLMVVLVTVQVLMIVTGIFGFMAIWGLTLSCITMIEIIMSVGFSVDFCAHVCTAYMVSEAQSRQDRARDAIIHASSPIFNGGMSSIIGVFALAFTDSYIFQAFFKIMLLVILFGVLHAVFLVPVVLSFIGPSAHVRLDEVSPPDLRDSTNQNGCDASAATHASSRANPALNNDIHSDTADVKQDKGEIQLNLTNGGATVDKRANECDELSSKLKPKTATFDENGIHLVSVKVQSKH